MGRNGLTYTLGPCYTKRGGVILFGRFLKAFNRFDFIMWSAPSKQQAGIAHGVRHT